MTPTSAPASAPPHSPNPFDTSLTALWASSAAQMFIVECPMQLPITPLPKLMAVSPLPPLDLQPPVPAGTIVTFKWDSSTFFVPVDPNAPLYIVYVNQILPPIFEEVTITGPGEGTVPVAAGAAGAVFAFLTTFSGGLTAIQLSQFGTLAGPAEVLLS